ncbi:hypothetical protein KPC_3710 [Acinetobacter stercoris]|uniref:DUF2345 domain-containing protein n=1 Tax=Acinetobacter stercoris TaxID=2126983 RepID=A0A2U3N4E5_9GAMM|nr:hypothetical protein KPC_3710 [Acinetobacter stercoris]
MTGGSGLNGLLNTAQSFMSSFNKDTENSENTSAENQSNGTLFRQALMLFASPNGIAMTTPEDIVNHAGQEIGFSSGGSTNFSSQKNILMHAQGKYTAFAVNGISVIAANEKIQMHAQNALMELFARLDIKITATEGKILITSPIEVDIKAGGSQLLINQQGVFVNTDRYFKVQSGQHVFMSGEKVSMPQISLPIFNSNYSNKFDYSISKSELCKNDNFMTFVIDKNTGRLITQNKCIIKNNISSNRFFTEDSKTVIGILSFSDDIGITSNNLNSDYEDPLLDEALNLDNKG